jgi:hypothetical protein
MKKKPQNISELEEEDEEDVCNEMRGYATRSHVDGESRGVCI